MEAAIGADPGAALISEGAGPAFIAPSEAALARMEAAIGADPIAAPLKEGACPAFIACSGAETAPAALDASAGG